MLARLRKTQEENEGGFTLIELLVVIIIIGILAAIAIPTFLKQREKGYMADMKSAAKNAATAAESYATENNGSYATLDLTKLQAEGFKAGGTLTVTVPNADASHFCVNVSDNRLSGTTFIYNSNVGAPEKNGTCA